MQRRSGPTSVQPVGTSGFSAKAMITTSTLASRPVARGSYSIYGFLKSLIDPTLILMTLGASIWWHGHSVQPRDIVLGLLAFSLCYPGTIPFRLRRLGLLREIGVSWGLVAGLLLLLGHVTQYLGAYDQRVIVGWLAATPIVLWMAHVALPIMFPQLLTLRRQQRAILIGANGVGRKLAESINGDAFEARRIIACFDDRSASRVGDMASVPIAGSLEKVADFVKSNRVNIIYIALPMASQPRILALLQSLRDTTASIYFVPDMFCYDIIQARVDAVGSVPVLAVCESPFHGTAALVKRLTDLLFATCAVMLTAPVMLGIAVAVKLTSPGPVLFRQRRYGLDGEQIVVWKFRTMRVMEDGAQVRQATREDDRITVLGRFLRRTSLDELPQFFNVLQGRMSVVGPRPHAVAHNETYRRLVSGYMIRHKVKPGITGWAQVNGARGETDTVEAMERRIQYDLEYLRHWSVLLDASIVLKTVLLSLRGDPKAY